MSLYIDFNIRESDNARELLFNETTGTYNASANPSGWGTPNEATSAATAAVLKITPPRNRSYFRFIFNFSHSR